MSEALRAKIDRKSLQRGQFDPNFPVEGVAGCVKPSNVRNVIFLRVAVIARVSLIVLLSVLTHFICCFYCYFEQNIGSI